MESVTKYVFNFKTIKDGKTSEVEFQVVSKEEGGKVNAETTISKVDLQDKPLPQDLLFQGNFNKFDFLIDTATKAIRIALPGFRRVGVILKSSQAKQKVGFHCVPNDLDFYKDLSLLVEQLLDDDRPPREVSGAQGQSK